MDNQPKIAFAPELYIKSGVQDISFYAKAFGAVELRRWNNEDGSLHVAELTIEGAYFYLHEESVAKGRISPENGNGITAMIGLFVSDVDNFMKKAVSEGATEISPAQDYEYGYRQGILKDPFGHHWMIQKRI
jgi:PhnB protein